MMPTSLAVSAFNPALCLCIVALTIGVCRHAGNYLPAFLCVGRYLGLSVCLCLGLQYRAVTRDVLELKLL